MTNDKNTFYITTPIYYATGNPHLGHSYTSIGSDLIARFNRLLGKKTFFLTGTDEHGQKVADKAAEKNLTPQKFVDIESQKFQDLTETLNLSNDFFIRTTQEKHKQFVQEMLQKAFDNGDIYLGEYDGLYCVGCEKYYAEDELLEGHVCPDHKTVCENVKQENYFFKLSKYEDFLLNLYETTDFISPKHRKDEIINRVKAGLNDISISRPKESLTWGIEFPFDTNHVTYVWFDALFNYASAVEGKEFWPATNHIIGKDIMWFHMVYWPAFLKSVGLELPEKVHAHGIILDGEGHKMSKSLGNVVDPFAEIEQYGLDEFRYYVMSLGSFGEDCRYSRKDFESAINNELNNDLGNLASRVHTMTSKYCNNNIPVLNMESLEEIDRQLLAKLEIKSELEQFISSFELNKAISKIWETIRLVNAYVNEAQPFKVQDIQRRSQIMSVLNNSLYNIASYISFIMPQKAEVLVQQFGYELKQNLNVEYLTKEVELQEKIQLFQKVDSNKKEGSSSEKVDSNKKVKAESKIKVSFEKRKEIKAVLFDFDGVIVDTFETTFELAKQSNPNFTIDDFRDLLNGNIVSLEKDKFTKEQLDTFYSKLENFTKDILLEKKVKKELLNLKQQFQLFCVTSNLKSIVERTIEDSDLGRLFEEILCRDFKACKKEKIEYILDKYNLQQDEVVFVTDTLGDIREAKQAGILTIAVDFGFHEKERLEKGAPYKIVSSFKAIRKEIDKLTKHLTQEIEVEIKDSKFIKGTLKKLHPTQENKKVALFVHGFCANRLGCKSEDFSQHFLSNGYDFMSFDFLGCGDSDKEPISINSQLDQVKYLIELLTTEKKYEEVFLVGHSLGGLNVLSQKHKSISKKIVIAPLCFSRPLDELYEKLKISVEQKKLLKENKECTFIDDNKEYMLSRAFFSDYTQISQKKLQKLANKEDFQTLVLQAEKDPIIQTEYVKEFIGECNDKKVEYFEIENGTHSFKRNEFFENEQFYSKMNYFIEKGIEEKPLQFSDLRLQIGKIIEVENHPEADKLYVEKVDFGEFGVRQIVSGLKSYFTKKEMLGKKVLALTNLETAKLRGVESQGMLLLAESEEGELTFITADVKEGHFVQFEDIMAGSNNDISFDEFMTIKLSSNEGAIYFNDFEKQLSVDNKYLTTEKQINGLIR